MNDPTIDEPDFAVMEARLRTAVQTEKRRERVRRVALTCAGAGMGAVLLGGSFVFALTSYERNYAAQCFTEADTSSESLMSYLIPVEGDEDVSPSTLAVESCAASWRAGVIGQPPGTELENKYPVPPLVACEDQWGALKVFPTGDEKFCIEAGLKVPTTS